MFEIEKGHPIPSPLMGNRAGRKGIYPFSKMKFGESFFVPCEDGKKVRDAAKHYRARNVGWGYCARMVEGGVRVWRTA